VNKKTGYGLFFQNISMNWLIQIQDNGMHTIEIRGPSPGFEASNISSAVTLQDCSFIN
jgi:hypothetical protein